jgi:hypothetical protein
MAEDAGLQIEIRRRMLRRARFYEYFSTPLRGTELQTSEDANRRAHPRGGAHWAQGWDVQEGV